MEIPSATWPKVIGIGFHKTGTKTLAECLRILGYRHQSLNRELFLELLAGNLEDVLTHMEAFDSFEDWPWPLLYREAFARFPEARFVLTRRCDAEIWFESLAAHVRRMGEGGFKFRRFIYGYDHPWENRDHHIATYLAHNAAVRSFFADKGGRLLEVCWETGDGWRELCEFLGQPIRDLPFPHSNQARPAP
jgi:hypothetical protein